MGSMRARSTAAPIARAGLGSRVVLDLYHTGEEAVRGERPSKRARDIRDGGKHALIQTKKDIGHLGAADRGLAEDFFEAEVGQVADEGVRACVREGQAVAPEEPLEADDGDRQHGEEDERQG